MPARKPKPKRPATKEGRKLRSQVSKAKLGNRKIVEKTKTGKKKTIHSRSGELKKTVETKKVRTSRKKPNLQKAAKVGSIIGGAVGAGVAGTIKQKSTKKFYRGGSKNGSPMFKSGSMMTNAKGTLPNTYKPGGQNKTYVTSKGKYTGSKSNLNKAATAGTSAMGAAFGAMAGNLTAQGIAKLKGKSKTKKQRIVNGVNKTAQRQKLKSTRQAMRTKKKNIRRR